MSGTVTEEVRNDQHPVDNCFDWILAFASMTTRYIIWIPGLGLAGPIPE